jgi:hypothetical protein
MDSVCDEKKQARRNIVTEGQFLDIQILRSVLLNF